MGTEIGLDQKSSIFRGAGKERLKESFQTDDRRGRVRGGGGGCKTGMEEEDLLRDDVDVEPSAQVMAMAATGEGGGKGARRGRFARRA